MIHAEIGWNYLVAQTDGKVYSNLPHVGNLSVDKRLILLETWWRDVAVSFDDESHERVVRRVSYLNAHDRTVDENLKLGTAVYTGAPPRILRWGYKTGFAIGASEKSSKCGGYKQANISRGLLIILKFDDPSRLSIFVPHFSKCGGTSKQILVGACWIYWNLLSGEWRLVVALGLINIGRPRLMVLWIMVRDRISSNMPYFV